MKRHSRTVAHSLLLALAAIPTACAGRMPVRPAVPEQALRMPPGGLKARFGVSEWEREIQLCIDHLARPAGLGVARDRLAGFRTPFLEYGDPTLTAVRRSGFVYDCSLEEGFQDFEDGRNFIWPYSLDHGSPGNAATHERLGLPLVREHPGLWELPVYAFIRELLAWIQSPAPLANATPSGAPRTSAALGAGFRYSVFNQGPV